MEINKVIKYITLYCFPICLLFVFEVSVAKKNQRKIPVIFETDMGNDVDDALALAMLFRYADQGKVDILGIVNNKESLSSVQFVDLMCRQYGYSHVPIATVKDGVEGEEEARSFARKVMDYNKDGKSVFQSVISDYRTVDSAVKLYRKLLSSAEDNSVVVISVGFSTNLAALINSESDCFSPLIGYDLVAKKVKYVSAMAGSFNLQPKHREFNIVSDISSAETFFSRWPTQIYISPFEVGSAIRFPASVILQNLGYKDIHPLVQAYNLYLPMPYDREAWDLTSVLFAIEPKSQYFRSSQNGFVTVDKKGYTYFKADKNGKHSYLFEPTKSEVERIKQRLVNLIMAP